VRLENQEGIIATIMVSFAILKKLVLRIFSPKPARS
jgi:hypothetical protein